MTAPTLGRRPLADSLSRADTFWFGVHVATIDDNQDPLAQGRVSVLLPWSPDDSGRYQVWARLATMMAGADRGTWFVPDPGDEVLVAFEGGDPARPVVVGSLWNGTDTPPEQMDTDNTRRTILTGSGVRITLDDADGAITLETPNGQRIVADDNATSIVAEDSNGNSVTLDSAGVTVVASAKVAVQASTVQVDASMVTVNAGMSKFSGVVQCDTLLSNAVVSSSYTPGAGNIW